MQRPDLRAVERWHGVAGRAAESAAIEAEVSAWTTPQARAAVAARVAGAGIPSAPVRTISEVGSDPHLFERAVVRAVSTAERGTVNVLGTPIKLSGHAEPAVTPPPAIGADTDAVLRERLGLSAADLAVLRAAGVV